MTMPEFNFPTESQRVAIVGKTGSGKTHFGLWLLSHAHYDIQPYIIFDYKGEEFINGIEYLEELKLGEIPNEPGLYVVRPIPGQEDDVERMLWAIWARENIGLFIDECYMIDKNSKAFKACLTQGRSKHIPMYLLTQRPVEVSRFIFSESDYYAVFYLNDERDRETVGKFVPADLDERLPAHECTWYDVNPDEIMTLTPAPSKDTILERFNRRLKPVEPEAPKRIFI